eukprot:TRINITY_DN71328_c0_g1_i1.p1 TRINITY_DN71328_c0_g1~~TRINITY_DN71328_c0_g1_i1.p1  ORF type:complete len:298 (+),score=34.98 TRINITY_DN71328_c0_g1_i1:129-896(+)
MRAVVGIVLLWRCPLVGCFASGAGSAQQPRVPVPPQPCSEHLEECALASGSEDLRSLYAWLGPSAPMARVSLEQAGGGTLGAQVSSDLESKMFDLFRELGLAVLALVMDVSVLCGGSGGASAATVDARCSSAGQHFQQLQVLQQGAETRTAEFIQKYAPDTGVRSVFIKAARNMRSDIDSFLRRLPSFQDMTVLVSTAAQLAQTIGQRSHIAAHHVGLHSWIRTVAVPGRGAPMFILHDDYLSTTTICVLALQSS